MTMPHDDLQRWLDQATHRLPPQTAATIRAELTAHVEDTVADLVEQGVAEAAAYQRALATLGSPRTVANGFKHVYLGRRRYIAGLAISLLMVAEGFFFDALFSWLDIGETSTAGRLLYVLDHVLTVTLVCYVVITLRRLGEWRHNLPGLAMPVNLLLGGSAIYLVGNVILELTVDSWDPIPTLTTAASTFEWANVLIMQGGMLIIGVGVLLFGVRALAARDPLMKIAAGMASITGLCLVLALTLLYVNKMLSYVAGELWLLSGILIWPVIGLVFLQAIYTRYQQPPVKA